MTRKLKLRPTETDVAWWIDHFVPNPMLWWWDDADIPNESRAQRVIDRQGSRRDTLVGDIVFVNAFHTWAMNEDVKYIVVDDGRWIQSLTNEERCTASERQVRFNRGLCIPVQRFGEGLELPDPVQSHGRVVLDQSLWESLPLATKRLVIEAELADFDGDITYPVPNGTPHHIAEMANGFVQQEGVNCLAVTAFAITGDRDDLLQWMMPDAFESVLRIHEYAEIDEAVPKHGDIIVFRNDEENIVHAAYALGSDRILNKNGQTSFNPITITDLASLQGEWSDFQIALFR